MKYIKLKNNIVRVKNIVDVTKYDCLTKIPLLKGERPPCYIIILAIDDHDKYVKAEYENEAERDADFKRLMKILRVKDSNSPEKRGKVDKTVQKVNKNGVLLV